MDNISMAISLVGKEAAGVVPVENELTV